jgi:hypothetical protein
MPRPTWLAYGFAVVMVAVSVYCIGRLLLARPLNRRNHYDVNISHGLMGLAMAGMLVPRWNYLPDGAWEVIFAVIALWFLALSVRFAARHGTQGTDDAHVHHISHFLIHLVMACAMLYMYWLGALTAGNGMSMSSRAVSAGDPALTLLLVTVLLASAVWQFDTISRFAPQPPTLVSVSGGVATAAASGLAGEGGAAPEQRLNPWLAPRLEIGCHVAMCLTMAYVLVLLL